MNDSILIITGYLILVAILSAAVGQGLFWLGFHHDRIKVAVQGVCTGMRASRPGRQRRPEQLLTALAHHTHDEAGQAVFRNPL